QARTCRQENDSLNISLPPCFCLRYLCLQNRRQYFASFLSVANRLLLPSPNNRGGEVRPQPGNNMKRREFIKGSVAASSLAALTLHELRGAAAERGPVGPQEYYELRAYRLKSDASRTLLDSYLEKAAIPAWNRLGARPVGVFIQQERSGKP